MPQKFHTMSRPIASARSAFTRTGIPFAVAALTLATSFVAPTPALARQPVERPGAELRVWLITAAPGDAGNPRASTVGLAESSTRGCSS